MVRHVGVHRADDAQVIDARRDVWEDLADLDPALAVLAESVGRGEGGPGTAFGAEILARQHLAGVPVERRLGIEGVDVRRPTVHEQVDDAFRLGREVRPARRERRQVGTVRSHTLRSGAEQTLGGEQIRQP